jgi:uncharacterized integral membrane protein (TIGR00698 family)
MNLERVLTIGATGFISTALTLVGTLGLAVALAKVLKTERTTALLIGAGTAICGGSAIAAVAPVIGAKPHQTSMALAVVFALNAVALFVFPSLGHALDLPAAAFGTWSALAIHDTSAVVGAALSFGPEAVEVATTVKLTRALWIVPMTVLVGRWVNAAESKAPKRPWFIAGFVACAAVVTFSESLRPLGQSLAAVARQCMVLVLFMIGVSVHRDSLRSVGWSTLAHGVILWVCVASVSLVWLTSR